jgi:glucosylceramidase
MTVQNEPGVDRLTLYWDPMTQRDFIKLNLGPTLNKAGYNPDKLKLMIFDNNVGDLQKWSDSILDDKDAAKWVSGIAFHWYRNSRTTGYPDTILDSIHQKHQNHFLISSEACNLEGVGNGKWDIGEAYAHDIIRVSIR